MKFNGFLQLTRILGKYLHKLSNDTPIMFVLTRTLYKRHILIAYPEEQQATEEIDKKPASKTEISAN